MSSITIVKLDSNSDDGRRLSLLTEVCQLLFAEWSKNYKTRYGVNSVAELISFYEKNPQISLYIALDDEGRVKGCYSMSSKGNLLWLADMYVVPEHRKKGIGKLLVNHALSFDKDVALYTTKETISYYEMFDFDLGLLYTAVDLEGKPFEFYSMIHKAPVNGHIIAISILALLGIGILLIIWFMF